MGTRQGRSDRLRQHLVLCSPSQEGSCRRCRSRDPQDLRQTRHTPPRARYAARQDHWHRTVGRRDFLDHGCRCHCRFGFAEDHLPRQTCRTRHHLLLVWRSSARVSRPRPQVPRQGSTCARQLLFSPQLGRLLRWLVRLYPQGRTLPHGTGILLPHQLQWYRSVRTHPHHRRRGGLRFLPRRVHCTYAR